jgi:ABC-type Na+ transport system ATPase subunit NatA
VNCFITGSTDGLGRAAAGALIRQGHDVVLHARCRERAAALSDLAADAAGIVTGDLSSAAETRDLAGQVNQIGAMDAVIHNAGVFLEPSRGATADGHATTLAVNTLAPYLLTALIGRPDRAHLPQQRAASHRCRVQLIGLTGQFAAVDELLTGRENLEMFGRLFKLPGEQARRRAGELLERFGLAQAADRPARTYSGGMRRRLDIASSLLTRPQVLFLDEPTTGLDPRSRNEIWAAVRELRREGTTLLLTTQYLEEADQLADRIAVIDRGRVIAEGTGNELKDRVGGQILEVELGSAGQRDRAQAVLAGVGCGEPEPDERPDRLTLPAPRYGLALVEEAAAGLRRAQIGVSDIGLRRVRRRDRPLAAARGHLRRLPATRDLRPVGHLRRLADGSRPEGRPDTRGG